MEAVVPRITYSSRLGSAGPRRRMRRIVAPEYPATRMIFQRPGAGNGPATPASTPIQHTEQAARVADHYHSASEHGIIGRRIDTVVADRRAVGGALAGHGSHEVRVEEGDAAWRR